MDYADIKLAAKALKDKTIQDRRKIHASPELSFEEHETARFIAEELRRTGISFCTIAGTGILAKIEGIKGEVTEANSATTDAKLRGEESANSELKTAGKWCVILRADIDALPIQEENKCSYISENKGIMHACGHDIHTACLLSALTIINNNRHQISGTIFGLFQPAEELCPGGASLVLAEDPFRGYDVKAIIGQHVATELAIGTVGFRSGKYMASSDEVRIKVIGTGGHGALPHNLTDPVVAAAELITSLQNIVSRNANATIPTVLSIGRVIANGATNVIPKEVYMEGTLRTMDEAWRERAKLRIKEIAAGIAMIHNVDIEVNIADGGYPCVVNDATLTQHARAICSQMWGDSGVTELDLRMTAEDFGHYTKLYPSLFFRLGTAHTDGTPTGSLHTSTFNPNEGALEIGVATLAALAIDFSNR